VRRRGVKPKLQHPACATFLPAKNPPSPLACRWRIRVRNLGVTQTSYRSDNYGHSATKFRYVLHYKTVLYAPEKLLGIVRNKARDANGNILPWCPYTLPGYWNPLPQLPCQEHRIYLNLSATDLQNLSPGTPLHCRVGLAVGCSRQQQPRLLQGPDGVCARNSGSSIGLDQG